MLSHRLDQTLLEEVLGRARFPQAGAPTTASTARRIAYSGW